MRSRLNTIAPDLDAALAAAPAQLRIRAGWSVACWAFERVGLSHPAVAEALATRDASSLSSVLEELDKQYFNLSDQHEDGRGPNATVMAAFRLARAASAVEFAAKGDAVEAVYEAAHAADEIPDIPAVRQLLASVLSGNA